MGRKEVESLPQRSPVVFPEMRRDFFSLKRSGKKEVEIRRDFLVTQKKWNGGFRKYDGTSFLRKVTSVAAKAEMGVGKAFLSCRRRKERESPSLSENLSERPFTEYDGHFWKAQATSFAPQRSGSAQKGEYDGQPKLVALV